MSEIRGKPIRQVLLYFFILVAVGVSINYVSHLGMWGKGTVSFITPVLQGERAEH